MRLFVFLLLFCFDCHEKTAVIICMPRMSKTNDGREDVENACSIKFTCCYFSFDFFYLNVLQIIRISSALTELWSKWNRKKGRTTERWREKERDGCIILLAIQTKTNPWLLACFHCFKLKSLWTISIPSISTTHTPALPATPHQKNMKKPNKTFKVLLFFVDSKDQCHIDSISLASLFSSPLCSPKTRTVFS